MLMSRLGATSSIWLLFVVSAWGSEDADIRQQQVPTATDLPSIANRFDQIDQKIEALKAKFVDLQSVVQQVKSAADTTGSQLVQSEVMLTQVRTLAGQNKEAASKLAAEFVDTAAKIGNASAEMNGLKNTLTGVEETALKLGMASGDIGKKVGDLETAVHELLPGRDYLPSRIKRAREHLQSYQASTASGALDPVVASTIRGNFLRAQKGAERMAEDALQAKLVEEDSDDDDGDSAAAL